MVLGYGNYLYVQDASRAGTERSESAPEKEAVGSPTR